MLNCQTVSDLQLLSEKGVIEYIDCGLKKDKRGQMSPLLLGYCGFDGYFRLVDLVKGTLTMTVKSYYGGFNAFTFSPHSHFLALAGQDDCATIVSMKNKGFIRIFQHNSFVSRVLFTPLNQFSTNINTSNLNNSDNPNNSTNQNNRKNQNNQNNINNSNNSKNSYNSN